MLISVIIPVYNVVSTLRRAVESVTAQTYQDLEILLVNDGSTDQSGALCDELAATDERIRVIHKENGGLSSARNVGIAAAKGVYLAFLDSDDYFDLAILDKFAQAKAKHADLDMFIFNVIRVNNGVESVQEAVAQVSSDKQQNVSVLFDYPGLNFYAWNKLYARKLFRDVRYPEAKLYEDIMPSYWTTKLADKVVTTTDTGIYYIQNEASIVASAFNAKQYDNVTERIRLLLEVQKDFPQLEGKALERLLDGFLSTGFKIATSAVSMETKEYFQILKRDIRVYLPKFKNNPDVSKVKLMALRLLLVNKILYQKLYRLYLGK